MAAAIFILRYVWCDSLVNQVVDERAWRVVRVADLAKVAINNLQVDERA